MILIDHVERGEIYLANLECGIGREQKGIRPVVIIQNDVGNRHSPTTIIAPVSSKIEKKHLPTHIQIHKRHGINKESIVMLEQIRVIDKARLIEKIDILTEKEILMMNKAMLISVGIIN